MHSSIAACIYNYIDDKVRNSQSCIMLVTRMCRREVDGDNAGKVCKLSQNCEFLSENGSAG